jgi:hypothetical protein
MQGSDDMSQPLDGLRARQEGELAATFSVASMEYALAREAFHVGVTMRQAGIGFDPVTFVALRVLEASVAELEDPCNGLAALAENGSIGRSAELASELLERSAG